jgi:N-acetylglutamate synthase-like GNAT family acetyltransferase
MSKEQQLNTLQSSEKTQNKVIPIVPDETRVDLAEWVSKLTSTAGTMLPKTEEEVLQMFSEKRSIILLDETGNPVAHSAITFIYKDQHFIELGGVIVAPEFRKKGIGTLAAHASIVLAETYYPGWTKLVLCNAASLPIFLGLGGTVVDFEQLSSVPVEAWEACTTCPKYAQTKAQGKICCDTPVIIP